MNMKAVLCKVSMVVFLIGIQQAALAAVYKCETAKGKISYSDEPCKNKEKTTVVFKDKKKPKVSNDAAVSDLVTNNPVSNDQSPKTIENIQLASDGLKLMRLDGFGPYALGDIKTKATKGVPFKESFIYPGAPWSPQESHVFSIESTEYYTYIMYWAEGTNYKVFSNPQKQMEEDKENNEYTTHFDVTKEQVNEHAISIGMEDKGRLAKTSGSGTHMIEWKWEQDGFQCRLSVSAVAWASPQHLYYRCDLDK